MKKDSKKVSGGILSDGWYYLIFLLMTIGGFALGFAVPGSFVIGAIGFTIGFVGFYSLVGVPTEKYVYSETKIVKLDSGEEVKCVLIRKRKHFISIILMFISARLGLLFSLFNHVPLGTQYFIASNVDRVTDESGKFEEGQFENLFDYLNCEQITKNQYKELMRNPQLYKDALSQKLSKQRDTFFKVIEKFEKNNLVERELCTNTYAIYKFSDELMKVLDNISPENNDLRIKFNYTGDTESQKGFLAFVSLLKDGISYEQQFPFERIITESDEELAIQYIELSNSLFSSLTINKAVNENGDKKIVDVDNLEDIKETDSRDIITKEMVCYVARNKRKGGLILLCVLAYYFAIPVVVLTIFSLINFLILWFFCFLAISIALIWLAEHCRRKNKAISRVPSIDEIEIVKTYCADKQEKNSDGKSTLVYTLGNGAQVSDENNRYNLQENATCYIIYRKPENEIKWIYSSIRFRLASDLKVTDTIEK